MSDELAHERTNATAEEVARRSRGKLVAFLAARSGDLAAAEDALSDAFAAALTVWPREGCPDNPEAWLRLIPPSEPCESCRHNARCAQEHAPEFLAPASKSN